MRKNGGRIITLVLCLVLIIPLVSLLATAGRTSSAANGKDGRDGKSAYQYAVDAGFIGSEEDFAKYLEGTVKEGSRSKYLSLVNNKVICIGDSLTSGSFYNEQFSDTPIPENYPYYLEKLSGWKITNAGRSGQMPSIFYKVFMSAYDFAEYDTAIIWLGTNGGGLTDTIEEDTASGEPTSYAKTETGYYCRIIEEIISQNPKINIILGTMFECFSGNLEVTNKVVHKIDDRYENVVGVVDLNIPELNDLDNDIIHREGVHFTKVGNACLAEVWFNGICDIISSDPLLFDRYSLYTGDFSYEDYEFPIVYLEGNTWAMTKDNKVTLNYTYGDKSGTCSVKWQGSSSLQFPKKNYTITFDNAFEAVEGWGEQSKYCLKADWVDFSHARNVVSAGLWGDIVATREAGEITNKLKTLPNGGAIDGFSCFVVINGEWQGIYNFNIPKDGWMMGMGSGEKEAILCAETYSDATLMKTGAILGTDFEVEYNSDSFSESEIQASLDTLINAVINSDGSDIDTVIAQYVDIDSAIDYLIFSQLISHYDGIGKNYLLCTYDGTKWFFSAYDLDLVFGLGYPGTNYLRYEHDERSLSHRLFELLWLYKFDEVSERYNEIVNTVMPKDVVAQKFYNYCAAIPLTAYDAEAKKWESIPSTAVNNASQLAFWYSERLDFLAEKYSNEAYFRGTPGLIYEFVANNTLTHCIDDGTCTERDVEIGYTAYGVRVSEIAQNAFKDNKYIESLRFNGESYVYYIRPYAFSYCTNLKSVDLPSSLQVVGYSAFGSCTSLKEVELKEKVRTVQGLAFANCTSLEKVYISNSVTLFETKAFYNCSSLEQIIYNGTVEEWNAIEKGQDWDTGTGSYTVYCTDGEVVKATE